MKRKKRRTSSKRGLCSLAKTAAKYLEHPDVVAMPFALNPSVLARQLRKACR
jgi:hypothetical protein